MHTPPPPNAHNCCAIIVVYFPDTAFFSRLDAWTACFQQLVLVSNGATEAFWQQFANYRAHSSATFTLISNPHNLGIAAALNQGLNLALAQQFTWVVTFDQDTQCYPFLLQEFEHIYSNASDKPLLLGSNYWHAALNQPLMPENATGCCFERKTIISSGMLLWTGLPAIIGYFREDYFIDSVDHEFALRARRHGYRVWISSRLLMHHHIGSARTDHRCRYLRIPEHSALRKYYIFRNCLTTVFSYARQEPVWCLRQFVRLAVELLAIIGYERPKLRKLRAAFLGLSHAVRGKMGELRDTPCISDAL